MNEIGKKKNDKAHQLCLRDILVFLQDTTTNCYVANLTLHPFPGDLPAKSIPISMKVVGCPINFQLTAAIGDITPVVRFGGHIAGGPTVNRQMRINNTSPFPVRIDWETFNVRPKDDQVSSPFPI